MQHWLIFILSSVGIWRAAELIAYDAGPFRMFKRWRDLWISRPLIHELFTCPYCVSGYLAIGASVVLWWDGYSPVVPWFGYWFAIWGGAMVILRAVRKRR